MRHALVLLTLLFVTASDVSAASPGSECRRACGSSKRTCIAGSKSLFQSAKSDCQKAVSNDVRKACLKAAKGQFRSFKQACATSLKSCKGCCAASSDPSCATSGGSPVDTSALCGGITGGLAAYFDWLNGVFHPLARIPTAGAFWVPYQHPGYPLLGFLHPPDWTPFTIAASQTIGVNLIRDDNAAVWREVGTFGDVSAGVRAIRDVEVSAALEFLGNPSPVTTVCVIEGSAALAPGIVGTGSNIIVTAGAFTIITKANVTTLEGVAGGQIFFNTIIAPTAEMNQLAFDVFLPIHFQLFVGTSTQDSDLDGIPDSQDNAPNDPTRS